MTIEGLGYINSILEGLEVPYEFMEWSSDVPDTYWTGEYQEIEPLNEDGLEECDFLLMGNTNKTYLELETVKEKLKNLLGCEGLTDILPSGSGIVICYSNAYPVPSVEAGIHRIQITLRIKEFRI